MGFFERLGPGEGGYIFISHSHNDIAKVREIRNGLEQHGFEPLCFYLKCLSDDSEVEDLIKREIDAREWFLFVNSENSRNSKWVTLEREYISRSNSKKIITVDLDDEQAISSIVDKITHNLRVFISYSRRDLPIARIIKERLIAKDYLVYFDVDDITISGDFQTKIVHAIEEASKEGCVFALITENSVTSPWVRFEFEAACFMEGNIFPVMMGDVDLPPKWEFMLANRQIYHLPEQSTDEEIDRMIDYLGNVITRRSNR